MILAHGRSRLHACEVKEWMYEYVVGGEPVSKLFLMSSASSGPRIPGRARRRARESVVTDMKSHL